MSITNTQATRLGALVTGARLRLGLSQHDLARRLNVAQGWMAGLEQGRFLDPAADRLARVAETLDIEPKQIERIIGPAVRVGLPEMRTYFRAKYDLTPEQIDRIERYIQKMQRGDS